LYYVKLKYFVEISSFCLLKVKKIVVRRGWMRLSELFYKLTLVLLLIACSSVLYAYDYPVVGEYNANYQSVFEAIKTGRCDNMQDELKQLSESEGVSSNIYLAICYFEKADNEQAVKTMDNMLVAQEYDEVLYITQSLIDKGNPEPRLIKYRGLAYFNIGAFPKAIIDFDDYLTKFDDQDVLFSLVDIHISLKSYNKASAVLERSTVKNGRYYYRKGRIALRTSKTVSALKYLRMVKPEDVRVYPSAKMLIGEICTSSKRYICAEKEYNLAAQSDDYSDVAKEKLVKMEESKKLFTGFLSIGEQYDTNVTSVDENELPGASEVDSFRTYAVADIKLNFYPSFADRVSVGTMHYKTWNHSLPSYNMNTHKIYFEMKQGYDNFEIVLPRMSAAVTYFGGEKYSTAVALSTIATYKMDTWTFSVPLKVTKSNYEGDELTADLSKDGYKYEGTLNVAKKFMDIYTWKVSGGYAKDDVTGVQKRKSDYTFKTSLSARWFERVTPTLGFNYALYDYDNINREDNYYSGSLKAIYVLTPNIFFGGGVTWTKTNSNENAYDYVKTVTEVSVSYSF